MAFPTALKRPWRNRASLSARRASPARAASPPRENGDSGRVSGLLGGEPSPERRDLNQPPVMGDAGGLMSSPVDVRRGSTRICGSAAESAAQPRRGAGPRCRGGVFALGPKDIERGWRAFAPLRAPRWGRRGVGTLQRPHRGFRLFADDAFSRPGRRNVPDFHFQLTSLNCSRTGPVCEFRFFNQVGRSEKNAFSQISHRRTDTRARRTIPTPHVLHRLR